MQHLANHNQALARGRSYSRNNQALLDDKDTQLYSIQQVEAVLQKIQSNTESLALMDKSPNQDME